MAVARSPRLFAAGSVALLVMSACAARPEPPPAPALPPVTTRAELCPAAYPTALSVQPQTVAEAAVQATLIVCTGANRAGIFLYNATDNTVWAIDQPESLLGRRAMAPRTLQVSTFQEFLQTDRRIRGVSLPPRASFEDSTVDPNAVRVSLDASAQAAWQVLTLAVTSVANQIRPGAANRIEMAAHRVLSSTSASREAVLACMAEGFDARQAITQGALGNHVHRLEAALDVTGSTGPCADAIRRAEQTAAVAGFTGEELLDAMRASPFWDEAEILFDLAGRPVAPFLAPRPA